MTLTEFVTKRRDNPLTKHQASHTFLIDLCRLLDEPVPHGAGTDDEAYISGGVQTKTTGADGWANVWERGEYTALESARLGLDCKRAQPHFVRRITIRR